MARGKRYVSEVQTIKVKKYQVERPEPEGEVRQNVVTKEVKKGDGIFSGLVGRKKNKRPPQTKGAEDFVAAMEG